MDRVLKPAELTNRVNELRAEGKKISLIPTMGNLHEGHLSLISKARKENDVVVVSIFVNPLQFGSSEDFKEYPKAIDEDLKKLKDLNCDIVFIPSVEDMYPKGCSSVFVIEELTSRYLCSKFRSSHFRGVLTVVLKLFNICKPHRAYFGLKDYEQYILIKEMTDVLNLNVEVIGCPLIRDSDGLALSSRNLYLDTDQRKRALSLYEALTIVKDAFDEGETKIDALKKIALGTLLPNLDIQYLEILDSNNLQRVSKAQRDNLVAACAFCDDVRLIDNITL